MLIDTHCHLGDPAFDADRGEVVERMRAADVGRALVIESRVGSISATREWVAADPALGLACGCHPHDAASWSPQIRDAIVAAWGDPVVRAAGEVGLDYHYNHAPRDVQQRVFAEQLDLARAAALPVVIHAREADDDVAAILRDHPGLTIILHSFSSGLALERAGLDEGWYFSFSGMVTFKSWTRQDVVRAVASDRILIETDSPYLAPVPHRGGRNEPAFVAEVARTVAALRAVTYEELAATTTANAMRLFWERPANP